MIVVQATIYYTISIFRNHETDLKPANGNFLITLWPQHNKYPGRIVILHYGCFGHCRDTGAVAK